jgi:AraC-like DNA-binding protein
MESHKMNILGDTPYERYAIHFSPKLLEQVDPIKKLMFPFENRPLGEKNIFYATEFDIHPKVLFSAMDITGMSDDEKRTAILINLFPLLGQVASVYATKKHESFVNQKPLVVEIANYINKHLFDELSLDILSNKFYISSSQLSRQFKQATGSPLWEYIVNKRLVAVQSLIRNGQPITTAYAECGFKDYSSFYRLYIRKFGKSPKHDIYKS